MHGLIIAVLTISYVAVIAGWWHFIGGELYKTVGYSLLAATMLTLALILAVSLKVIA